MGESSLGTTAASMAWKPQGQFILRSGVLEPFYPVMYMLTRVKEQRLGTGRVGCKTSGGYEYIGCPPYISSICLYKAAINAEVIACQFCFDKGPMWHQ